MEGIFRSENLLQPTKNWESAALAALVATTAAWSPPLPADTLFPAALGAAAAARCRRALLAPNGAARALAAGGAPSPEISPVDFGADPTGAADSSPAFARALAVLLSRNATGGTLGAGIADLGGATLALGGGVYSLSAPLVIPPLVGNLRVAGGTLRAGAGFPAGRALVETGAAGCTDTCNVNFALEDLLLDGGLRARGGVWARGAFGARLAGLYVINFTTTGIDVESGHEVVLSSSWVAQVPLGDRRRENATFAAGSTGVLLNGNDHFVSDVICFGAAVGLNVSGAANIIRGFHVWGLSSPFGGVGILVNAAQTRLEGVYLDGSPLVIAKPELVSVTDSFFLCSGLNVSGQLWPQVVIDASANGAVVGLTVTGSIFSGWFCEPFVVRGDVARVAAVNIQSNVLNYGTPAPALSATAVVTAAEPTTRFEFDFSPLLVFGNRTLKSVAFSLTLPPGVFARAAARAGAGALAVVETDLPVVGSATITASH